jgi:hypothetical protein
LNLIGGSPGREVQVSFGGTDTSAPVFVTLQ